MPATPAKPTDIPDGYVHHSELRTRGWSAASIRHSLLDAGHGLKSACAPPGDPNTSPYWYRDSAAAEHESTESWARIAAKEQRKARRARRNVILNVLFHPVFNGQGWYECNQIKPTGIKQIRFADAAEMDGYIDSQWYALRLADLESAGALDTDPEVNWFVESQTNNHYGAEEAFLEHLLQMMADHGITTTLAPAQPEALLAREPSMGGHPGFRDWECPQCGEVLCMDERDCWECGYILRRMPTRYADLS